MQIAKCKLSIEGGHNYICGLEMGYASLRRGITVCLAAIFLIVLTAFVGADARAADNELLPAEKAEGWVLLFDGVGLQSWKNNDGKPLLAKIEDGAINPHGCGGYIMVYDKEFEN